MMKKTVFSRHIPKWPCSFWARTGYVRLTIYQQYFSQIDIIFSNWNQIGIKSCHTSLWAISNLISDFQFESPFFQLEISLFSNWNSFDSNWKSSHSKNFQLESIGKKFSNWIQFDSNWKKVYLFERSTVDTLLSERALRTSCT